MSVSCGRTVVFSIQHHVIKFVSVLWQDGGFLYTTLCDNVCQCLVAGRWFSPGFPVSSTNKTDCQDITEILLKVALITNENKVFLVQCSCSCSKVLWQYGVVQYMTCEHCLFELVVFAVFIIENFTTFWYFDAFNKS